MVNVATENSMNHSINKAVKHYASLFFLPTFKKALVAVAVLCIGIVGLSTFTLFQSVDGLISSLFFGISLFAVTILVDYVISKIVLRDPIYVLRRMVALSLFGWLFWLFFTILGVVFGTVFSFWWWIKLCLLGFAVVLTLRFVVFLASNSPTSSTSHSYVPFTPRSESLWKYKCFIIS